MRRRTIIGLASSVAAIGLVVTASVVWPGLDAQETPKVDGSVWAMQTGDGRRYARVNTAIGELDTVRSVSDPSRVVQSAGGAFLFSESYSKLTPIDTARPIDLDETALRASESTPAGTVDVVTAGDFVAYRTDAGAVFVGSLSRADARQVDPLAADEDAPQYSSDAIAIDDRGMLFSYSSTDSSVLSYDIGSSRILAIEQLAAEDVAAPLISAAGDAWVVVDADSGEAWIRGVPEPAAAPTTGALLLSEPYPEGDAVYIADETTLLRVPVDGSPVQTEVGTGVTVLGIPAQPIVHAGVVYAAWLPATGDTGLLWSSDGQQSVLDYGGQAPPDQRRPVFVAGSDAVILNETRSGWVWTVPDGGLVVSSQDWTLDERTNPAAEQSDEQLAVVIDPKPPVAEPDAFGVRAGSLATLPVLMNDHDPNEDVLSIDPESVTGLDPGFGALSITDNGQRIAVRVSPDAEGSATFSYAVTDGTSADGLLSQPATVTLTVVPEGVNSAPQWCAVDGCLVPWPEPEVARGRTVTVPVLPGWVDPDGDPLLLLSVQNPSGVGSVAATPAGEVVYQHSDDGSGGDQLIPLELTVSDTAGATTTRSLVVRVTPDPGFTVHSFAIVDSIDAGLTVDVAPHVTGTTGTLSLKAVRVLDDAAATATVIDGTTSFDFVARNPGAFRVSLTVTDGTVDVIGTARITVVPEDASAQLATAPVVAFVYPQEDATLDVFTAVTNPTRRVLLLSDVVARPDPGASLSVDAVGQNHLRLSGSTESGAGGRLGTVGYVVSDGTDDEGSRVEGEATVYLLPPAPELAPIALDDTVIVRAGSQIDIPVLDNDISPAGGRPILNPASVISSSPDALAFGSGSVVRYLAPTRPGVYSVDYSVYTAGTPGLEDRATVRIRVLPDDANRAPLPETLEGRVLSGQSTIIDLDGFGVDPDGDVVMLDRIVTQPERGSATISADGESIVYSSVPGDRGQVSFRYRVVDAFGARGEGTVRIGVLDSQSNPSPITYSDYVQVQAGEGNSIRVSPLANDIDPTGGALTLTDVRPDLPATLVDGSANPEYARLADRVAFVDDTVVVIEAGESPTTMSFLYDVEADSGNTARGRIVVKVVRESVPDYPIVSDTILTAETRDQFIDGVDVLADNVTWSGGDQAALEVSLWGDQRDVAVDGRMLSGPLPQQTRTIPFAITGEGLSGEVTTYAFLRVPGEGQTALALRTGFVAPEVEELDSVAFDMSTLVAVPRGQAIEVGGEVRVSGARGGSTCALESGTTVRYDAGVGAPWTDACRVPVRLTGQEEWTELSVPVRVRALDPQPELRAGSITVGPGETVTFDLRNMTTWQLREDWAGIRYDIDDTATSFAVTLDDPIVTVTGDDRAVPGGEEAVLVSVPSHPGVAPVRLILRVGAAPSTLPQGGSVVQQCSQASGSSCVIPVIGVSGEVNPLPSTPLEVVDVQPAAACTGVTFSLASPTSVLASWAPDAPGATCAASFSVVDAQGRRTNAERDGRILLDLLGYPRAPANVRQVDVTADSVTLRIDPGDARAAYPALTGFVVRLGAEVVAQCGVDGVCPPIAAPNGEVRTYAAASVNSVGESLSSVQTTAWAYDAPPAPTAVRAAPVVTSSGTGEVVSLVIEGIDTAVTGSIEITSPRGEVLRVPVGRSPRIEVSSYRVGTNSQSPVTVTPYSRFELPPGLDLTLAGSAVTVQTNGVGAPLAPVLTLESRSTGNGTSTVTATGSATRNGDGSTLRYGIVRQGTTCSVSAGGNQAVFRGLADGDEYGFTLCVESRLGEHSFGRVTVTQSVRAVQSAEPPRGWQFAVDRAPDVADGRAQWVIRDQPRSTETLPNRNRAEFSGGTPSSVFDRDPGIRVRYVHESWGPTTDWAPVTAAADSAPYQVWARWQIPSCEGGQGLTTWYESSNGLARFAETAIRYRVDGDWVVGDRAVPVGADRVEVALRVDWAGQSWGSRLDAATQTFDVACVPNLPEPEPEPEPEPDAGDED